jgi:predicted metalloprotease with PDZ domain
MSSSPLKYSVSLDDVHGHRFGVVLYISQNILRNRVARLQLPAWIPGSYMLRDFAKHIETISAYEVRQKKDIKHQLDIRKVDSHTWELPRTQGDVRVEYQVYAFDTSVRAAYLDQNRAFFNPSSLCLQLLETSYPCEIEVLSPGIKGWKVETTLAAKKIDSAGFGIYSANTYDELIDYPFALGQFQETNWSSHGVPHKMMIQGAINQVDALLLKKDLKAICDTHIAFFEPVAQRPPFKSYTFIVNAVGDGYGGLEHRDCTVLLCKRDDLPYLNKNSRRSLAYEDFLGLCSHEYFHAWMVKRVKPKAFEPYLLDRANHTELLWLFEGFTSYYDDLQLLRSGRIDFSAYLTRIEKTWNMVLRGPGRFKQSVAQSSFDAWTKYYQIDENTPNAVVSYYAKGSLIALALDLMIRKHTKNQHSLDNIIRHLWQMYQLTELGMSEYDFDRAIEFILGPSFQGAWKTFKENYIFGTRDLPLKELLSSANVRVIDKALNPAEDADAAKQLLGIRNMAVNGWIKLTHVFDGAYAYQAGLSAGDFISSIDGERVTPSRWDGLLLNLIRKLNCQEEVSITAYRHETQFHVVITPSPNIQKPEQYSLKPV